MHGTADDPARYANERILDYRYALTDVRGPAGHGPTRVLGPWLPKNILDRRGARSRSRAIRSAAGSPPRRSRRAGTAARAARSTIRPRCASSRATRSSRGSPRAQLAGFSIDALDPNSAIAIALFAPDTVISEASRGKCERAGVASCTVGTTFPDPDGAGTYTVKALNDFPPTPLAGAADFSLGTTVAGALVPAFGGDFSGVVPCVDPTDPQLAARQRGEAGARPARRERGLHAGLVRDGDPGRCHAVRPPRDEPAEPALHRRPRRERRSGPRPTARSTATRQRRAARRAGPLPAERRAAPHAALGRSRHAEVQLQRDGARLEPRREPAAHQGAQGGLRRPRDARPPALDAARAPEHRLGQDRGVPHHRPVQPAGPRALVAAHARGVAHRAVVGALRVLALRRGPARGRARSRSRRTSTSSSRPTSARAASPTRPISSARSPTAIATHSYLGVGIAGVDRPESPWKDLATSRSAGASSGAGTASASR